MSNQTRKLSAEDVKSLESTLDTSIEELGEICPKSYQQLKDAQKAMQKELTEKGYTGYWSPKGA